MCILSTCAHAPNTDMLLVLNIPAIFCDILFIVRMSCSKVLPQKLGCVIQTARTDGNSATCFLTVPKIFFLSGFSCTVPPLNTDGIRYA